MAEVCTAVADNGEVVCEPGVPEHGGGVAADADGLGGGEGVVLVEGVCRVGVQGRNQGVGFGQGSEVAADADGLGGGDVVGAWEGGARGGGRGQERIEGGGVGERGRQRGCWFRCTWDQWITIILVEAVCKALWKGLKRGPGEDRGGAVGEEWRRGERP